MDLTQIFPRSPKEKLAGLVHLPRMLDKARAFNDRTLGEYIYPCPLDEIILTFLQTDAETLAKMAANQSDEEIGAWAESKCRGRTTLEMGSINREIIERKPDTREKLEKFIELRNQIDPSRTEVVTWVELIDLEEGRFAIR